jgi:hypothetical protein
MGEWLKWDNLDIGFCLPWTGLHRELVAALVSSGLLWSPLLCSRLQQEGKGWGGSSMRHAPCNIAHYTRFSVNTANTCPTGPLEASCMSCLQTQGHKTLSIRSTTDIYSFQRREPIAVKAIRYRPVRLLTLPYAYSFSAIVIAPCFPTEELRARPDSTGAD